MRLNNRCVLGILYGNFWDGVGALGLSSAEWIEYGFYLRYEELGLYPILTECWKSALEESAK